MRSARARRATTTNLGNYTVGNTPRKYRNPETVLGYGITCHDHRTHLSGRSGTVAALAATSASLRRELVLQKATIYPEIHCFVVFEGNVCFISILKKLLEQYWIDGRTQCSSANRIFSSAAMSLLASCLWNHLSILIYHSLQYLTRNVWLICSVWRNVCVTSSSSSHFQRYQDLDDSCGVVAVNDARSSKILRPLHFAWCLALFIDCTLYTRPDLSIILFSSSYQYLIRARLSVWLKKKFNVI